MMSLPMLHVVFAKVEHDLKEETKVDGFQEPGSFSQRVTYLAPKEVRANKFQQIKLDLSRQLSKKYFSQVIERLVAVSLNCRQSLAYFCRNSRLLNSRSSQYQVH